MSEFHYCLSRNKQRVNPLTPMLGVSDPNVVRGRAKLDHEVKFEGNRQPWMALYLKLEADQMTKKTPCASLTDSQNSP